MNKKFLFRLMFNIIETIIIFMIGLIFKVNISLIIVLMLIYFFTRLLFGGPKHYATWQRCFLWSTLVFTSLYALSSLDLLAIVLFTIFTGFISTGKADINDMYMWRGNILNNTVFDWVKFNQDNEKLKKYENQLKETDKQKYFIFIYRFREFKSYNEIAKLMDTEVQRISEEIKIMSHFIEYSIRLDN